MYQEPIFKFISHFGCVCRDCILCLYLEHQSHSLGVVRSTFEFSLSDAVSFLRAVNFSWIKLICRLLIFYISLGLLSHQKQSWQSCVFVLFFLIYHTNRFAECVRVGGAGVPMCFDSMHEKKKWISHFLSSLIGYHEGADLHMVGVS